MIEALARNWWMLAVRGVVALIFGVMAWVWPGITVLALIILFGAYALADGVFALVAAARGVPGQSRGWLAVSGVCGVLLGLFAFAWPAATGLVLLVLIAAWAVVTGVMEIVAAISMRHEIRGEWWLVLAGAVSVLFGLLLFSAPVSGAIAVVWVIGLFSILYGIVLLGAAFRVRKLLRTRGRYPVAPG